MLGLATECPERTLFTCFAAGSEAVPSCRRSTFQLLPNNADPRLPSASHLLHLESEGFFLPILRYLLTNAFRLMN